MGRGRDGNGRRGPGRLAGQPEVEIDLTPMIDVVFQLIIFFLCTLKFKTFESKIEAFLPEVGHCTDPVDEQPLPLTVRVHQAPKEAIPRLWFMGSEIEPGRGRGIARLPAPVPTASPDERRVYEERLTALRSAHLLPKIRALSAKVRLAHLASPKSPGQIDASTTTRHASVIAVLDAFIAAGLTDVQFVGTPD